MRKLLLLKSLFLDKNLNRIDSIIPTLIIFILRNASFIGWVAVAVAVAVASVVLAVQKALHRHHLIRVSCLFELHNSVVVTKILRGADPVTYYFASSVKNQENYIGTRYKTSI